MIPLFLNIKMNEYKNIFIQKKEGINMSGLTIVGLCIVAIAILTIVWGAFEHGVKLFDLDFMSYAVGGLVCLIIGLLMISFVPSSVTIVVIGLTALSSMLYIYGFDHMDLILKLMSFVPILGFATWLILHLMN